MKMRRLILNVSLVCLIVSGCAQKPSKEEVISNFESQMSELCLESNALLDSAIDELKNGQDASEVTNRIKEPLQHLEQQIDSISKAFAPLANRAGLTKDEFEGVYKRLGEKVQPMMNKYENLQEKGVEI